jgi:phosphoglycolate phosphatase
MTIEAILFDLDGTLVDTLDDITKGVNTCLEAMGEGPRSREEVRMMVGDGVDTLCRRALNGPDPAKVSEMVARLRAYYGELLVDTAAPYQGIEAMLEVVLKKGVRVSVLSNKPDAMTREIVERMFKQDTFEIIVGHREDLPRKPDPAGALWIAKRMNLPPEAFLFVGDSEVDLATGRAAGMNVLGVTWGFRTEDELNAAGARSLAHQPEDILEWVDG